MGCTMPAMYTIILILLVLWILWPGFRYGLFFLSQKKAGSLPEIQERLGGLVWPVIRGTLTGIVAEQLAVIHYPFFWRDKDEGGDGPVVLLVHGLFHNRSAWRIMKRRLGKAGMTNLHTYQYNCITKRFPHAVDGLKLKLDALMAEYPGRKIFLVGHSQGALVNRCVAGLDKYKDHIGGMVALGGPHKGSDMAWIGMNLMSRDLIPGRATAQMVAAAPTAPCPKLALYSLVDDFVYPLSMLQPGEPGWEEKLVSPMNHVWMLYSGEVTCMVLAFLKEHEGG